MTTPHLIREFMIKNVLNKTALYKMIIRFPVSVYQIVTEFLGTTKGLATYSSRKEQISFLKTFMKAVSRLD